jgi:diguanylate cyclase (GGDEF)-like protein
MIPCYPEGGWGKHPGVLVKMMKGLQAQKLKREADYSRTLAEQVRERTRELGTKNDQLKQANLKLEEASLTDSLTGLRNRRYLMTQIDEDIVAVERDNAVLERRRPTGQADFLFLMIDLDGLKTINDTYGHMAGDMALLQLRDLLLGVCRKSDTIIRWGGDGFLVVGRGMSREDAECLAERIRATVANERFSVAVGKEVGLSCSVGFAKYPFMPQSPSNIKWEQVLTIADKALYAAKHSGRNAWVAIMSTDQTPKDNLLQHMHADLEEMVREGQLEVCSSVSDEQRLTWQQ